MFEQLYMKIVLHRIRRTVDFYLAAGERKPITESILIMTDMVQTNLKQTFSFDRELLM